MAHIKLLIIIIAYFCKVLSVFFFVFGESQASIDKAFNNTTRVETDSSEVGVITVAVVIMLFPAYNILEN